MKECAFKVYEAINENKLIPNDDQIEYLINNSFSEKVEDQKENYYSSKYNEIQRTHSSYNCKRNILTTGLQQEEFNGNHKYTSYLKAKNILPSNEEDLQKMKLHAFLRQVEENKKSYLDELTNPSTSLERKKEIVMKFN